MQHLIGPVEILKGRSEWASRHNGRFPFVPLAGLGHQTLFNEVEHGMPFLGSELGVQPEGPGEVHRHLLGPVDAGTGEPDFTHHRMAGFVPKLSAHVPVVAPRFVGRLGDDAGHHLRHIDFP